jgi:hypothetical protein
MYALLRRYRSGVGLTTNLLFLNRLRRFSRLLWGFYGGNLARELGDDGVVPPALLGSSLSLGVQLLPKIANLVLQGSDKLGLVAWYADVGRLVRLRRTIAQEDEHRASLLRSRQSAALYAATYRTLSYAQRSCSLGDSQALLVRLWFACMALSHAPMLYPSEPPRKPLEAILRRFSAFLGSWDQQRASGPLAGSVQRSPFAVVARHWLICGLPFY